MAGNAGRVVVVSYDEHLARYRMRRLTMWCSNDECPNHEDGLTVTYESENGVATITPEDCPLCGHDLLDDSPAEVG